MKILIFMSGLNGIGERGVLMPWAGEVRVIRSTEKALLVDYAGDQQWIPLSQIHDDSEIYKSDQIDVVGDLVLPQWLAENLGWD